MKVLNTVGDRIAYLMSENDVTAYKLSNNIGIHQTTVSNYIENKTKPKRLVLERIAHFFRAKIKWLEYGDGEIYLSRTIAEYNTFDQSAGIEFLILDKLENTGSISRDEIAILRNKIERGNAIEKAYAESMENLRKRYKIKN